MGSIYKITNTVTNKVYIGATTKPLEYRLKRHIYRAHSTYESDTKLYIAMRKYGKENFVIELLEECNNKEMPLKEKAWIKHYNSFENGYNSSKGGEVPNLLNNKLVIELQKQGCTYKEIHDKTGYCKNSIQKVLKQFS